MKAKLATLLLSLVLVSAGCKEKNPFEPPIFEDSYLHIVGASNQVDTFGVVFDYFNVDDVVIKNFFYGKNWPISGYAELTAGGQPDEFGNGKLYLHGIKYNSPIPGTHDTLMMNQDIILEAGERSTLGITDSAGQMIICKFKDELPMDIAPGKTLVRFINLKETAGSANLISTDGTIGVNGVAFRSASGFIEVNTGTYTLEAKDDGGAVIGSLNNFFLYERGAFTFFIGSGGQLFHFVN